ncbi:hypothetical protein EJB05_13058, partial [Eragrostis curvula]
MPFQFQFPWLKNPTSTTSTAAASTSNPSPSPIPAIPNPFAPIQAHLTSFLSSLPRTLPPSPLWARIPSPSSVQAKAPPSTAAALPASEIEERLAGVPVYALANAAQEFVLVSSTRAEERQGSEGSRPPPALGLLCFRREDADALLAQMESDMRAGSSVVPVALNKVIQLKSDGVAFRFLPDSSQVANALKLMQDEGLYAREGFPGVPIFQDCTALARLLTTPKLAPRWKITTKDLHCCLPVTILVDVICMTCKPTMQSRSLVLMSDNKRYRPAFFRKEDLDNSLHRTSRDQQKPNPAVRIGDTQVSSLEDIIKSMKDNSSSKWDDVVFIPPGFDLATGSKP